MGRPGAGVAAAGAGLFADAADSAIGARNAAAKAIAEIEILSMIVSPCGWSSLTEAFTLNG
jgi:hypothetical protein